MYITCTYIYIHIYIYLFLFTVASKRKINHPVFCFYFRIHIFWDGSVPQPSRGRDKEFPSFGKPFGVFSTHRAGRSSRVFLGSTK